NSENATGSVELDRRFADHGRVFVLGSLFGESRNNGTPAQINSTTVRELDAGGTWNLQQAGAINLHVYASRQNYDQTFSSIAADRNSEALTRAQRVPAQRLGFSAQWGKSIGDRQNLVAGLEEWDTHGQTEETGFSNGKTSSTLVAGAREVNWG